MLAFFYKNVRRDWYKEAHLTQYVRQDWHKKDLFC